MKKFYMIIAALLLGISGAWATTVSFSSDEIKRGGTTPATYYNASGNVVTSFDWCRSLKTNTTVPVTFTAGSVNCFSNYSGGFNTSGNLWITATVPSQYTITGVSFKAKIIDGGSKEVYVEGNTAGRVTLNSEYQTVSSGVLSGNSVRFRFENGNDGNNASECIVVFEDFAFTIDTELADAAQNITNNHFYRIITYNNGTEEGSTKYYLTSTGTLTDQLASAGEFRFTATTQNQFVPAGYAWMISADDGASNFTNPKNGYWNGRENERIWTGTQKRQNWEAQVFYYNGNKYAVRCTNASFDASWKSHAYWTVVVDDDDADNLPDAEYAESKSYIWQIEEIASVTYNLIYNGQTLASEVLDRASNYGTADLPSATWNVPYCTYTFSPNTIDANTETVNITMTWNGPFDFSTDFATAKWYNMSLRGKWAAYSTSGTPYPLYSTKSAATSQTRESMWAFVGNPYSGVRIINRKAGAGLYLSSYVTYTSSVGDAIMDGYADEYTLWAIGTNNNGFTLHCGNKYLYDANPKDAIRIFNGAAAGGASETGASLAVALPSFSDLAIAYLEEYADNHAVGKYFGLKEDVVDELKNQFVTAGDGITESVYNNTAIPAVDALWPGSSNANVNYPATGYYLLKSYYNKYMYTEDGTLYGNKESVDATTIVRLENNGDNTYNIAIQGKYLQAPTRSADVSLGTNAVAFTPTVVSAGIVSFGAGGTYGFLHTGSTQSYKVVGWEVGSTSAASKWSIEDVESVTVSLNGPVDGKYYATLCLPFDVTITGATAYTMTDNGTYLKANEVTENKVPAGTPVLLKGDAATAKATINTGEAFGQALECALTGTYVDKAVSGADDYFLGSNGTAVGFYHWAGSTLKANRAYLPAGQNSKGFALVFDDDDVTAIASAINGQMVNGQYFDLQGRKVANPQKGQIYILNGKKVLF